jgi:hypothetical protein
VANPDPTVKNQNPTRLLFGLEEIWENNIALPTAMTLNPLTDWLAEPPNNGPTSPWVDKGRYWNDCGGLNQTAGVNCDLTGTPNPPGGSTTHPDQHAYLFVPDATGGGVTFFGGNDGGAYRQHVPAGGDFSNLNWGDGINVGLYTLQPYDAGIARDGTIVAGLQDNGEMKIAPGGKEAHTIYGGDGFMTTIDPENSKNILEEYTYGVINLSLNGGNDWYNIAPGACNSSEAQFSTAIEQDPTIRGHVVVGCTQIQEGGGPGNPAGSTVYANPCAVPPGADPVTCQQSNSPWTTVFDLGTTTAPGVPADRNVACNVGSCNFNVPSAVSVRGENKYVGYCGYCDIVTGGVPFHSGLATNVGGGATPKIGSKDGWHIAAARCGNCQAGGKLPQRFINSVQMDPGNANTVYVTMGGYGRRWIPPGSLGDDVSKVGVGHVFVSYNHGDDFTDISGNLPDLPANWTTFHNGQLIVGTDAGVFIAPDAKGTNWGVLGAALPNAPVFTLRFQPGQPDRMVAATYGRGVWQYCFSAACQTAGAPLVTTPPSVITGTGGTPGTSTGAPLWPLLPTGLAVALASGLLARRRRRAPAN